MSKTISCAIVGAHFRPPAKFVIGVLPGGAKLRLQPEPENPYDPGAISVWAEPSAIPESQYGALAETLLGAGIDLDSVLEGPEIQLGYVAKSGGKPQADSGLPGNAELAEALGGDWDDLEAMLTFSADGKPLVRVVVAEGGA